MPGFCLNLHSGFLSFLLCSSSSSKCHFQNFVSSFLCFFVFSTSIPDFFHILQIIIYPPHSVNWSFYSFFSVRLLANATSKILSPASYAFCFFNFCPRRFPYSSNYHHLLYTAKRLYRKFETYIPRKETGGLGPNSYIHVSVSNLYIPLIGLPIVLQENMWTDPGNT
jgi:hypothetical protein